MQHSQFQELEKLGSGSFSDVYKVIRKDDKQLYAMKKIKMLRLSEKEKANALNEIRLLASLDHNFIIGYKEAFYSEDSKTLAIIMEYADGGDLAKQISQKQKSDSKFSEQELWKALIQITQGLKELHDKCILHRDIKCANIFISNDVYKLGDLNVSKIAQRGLLYTQTGTPYYASPEIWRDEPYDNKSDIWSLGCVLYEMCTQHPPFLAQDMEGLYKKIQKGVYPQMIGFSSQLQTLISHMLRLNSSSRPSCDQILNSHLMNTEFSRIFMNKSQLQQLNKKMMKTIQLPRNLGGLNDILPQKQYELENKENIQRDSTRYSIQKLIPLRRSVNQKSEVSQITYSIDLENEKKRVYRVSSVHDGVLPTLPCEIKPKVVTRRRPSSQYKSIEEEQLIERKVEAIQQRKKLQKQLSEQHPLPKPILKKQMSNLPYLYKNNATELEPDRQSKGIEQSPYQILRKNQRKINTQIQQ